MLQDLKKQGADSDYGNVSGASTETEGDQYLTMFTSKLRYHVKVQIEKKTVMSPIEIYFLRKRVAFVTSIVVLDPKMF